MPRLIRVFVFSFVDGNPRSIKLPSRIAGSLHQKRLRNTQYEAPSHLKYNEVMDLKTKLTESMKDAMKSGDTVRKNTVRMALAAIKQIEVDKRASLDDAAVMALLQKEIKNRREALEEAKKAERPDLASANEAEIAVLEAFLPKAMPVDELRALVQAAIAETGATTAGEMGKVMKAVMPKTAGRAPGDAVSAIVRELLK